jgi:hypothetical protein
MDIINNLRNILVQRLDGTLMGPPVHSQEFDQRTLTNMDVVTFEVTNGAKLRDPLPFGLLWEVIPMNINKSKLVIKTSPHTAPNIFNILRGQRTDKELWVSTQFTEQIVSPDSEFENDPTIEYSPIDEYLSLKTTRVIPTAALEAYVLSYPTKVSVDIPRVLRSISVVWSSSSDVGEQEARYLGTATGDSWSLPAQIDDSAISGGSEIPELQINYDDYSNQNLYGTAYAFFMPQNAVTIATVLTKLEELAGAAVVVWPTFKLASRTITATGQNISIRCNAQAQLNVDYADGGVTRVINAGSESSNISRNVTVSSVQLPPMLCDGITLSGTSKSTALSATAAVVLTNTPTSNTSTSSITRNDTIVGSVSPTTIPATQALPVSGLYLIDVKVAPYDWGYVKVYAEVFNATALAV